jgi:hypothetical protein
MGDERGSRVGAECKDDLRPAIERIVHRVEHSGCGRGWRAHPCGRADERIRAILSQLVEAPSGEAGRCGRFEGDERTCNEPPAEREVGGGTLHERRGRLLCPRPPIWLCAVVANERERAREREKIALDRANVDVDSVAAEVRDKGRHLDATRCAGIRDKTSQCRSIGRIVEPCAHRRAEAVH